MNFPGVLGSGGKGGRGKGERIAECGLKLLRRDVVVLGGCVKDALTDNPLVEGITKGRKCVQHLQW